MIRKFHLILALTALAAIPLVSCESDEDDGLSGPDETDYTDLLTNQVTNVIIPAMENYKTEMDAFANAVSSFASTTDEANLGNVRTTYQSAYLAYQAAATHDFYATANSGLVVRTNLYPVDTSVLSSLISSESYDFNTTAQERANGFPALDFLLYGPSDVVAYFSEDAKRMSFLEELVAFMKEKADGLVTSWTGPLKESFINNGGVQLGSSISVQLNDGMVYYEDHIRENKVGLPIGRIGPNDTPIEADATLIEGYYQSLAEGNEDFTLSLVRASIEEIEDAYLGEATDGTNGQGYDDLLTSLDQESIDTDIQAQFQAIYTVLDSRTSISGNTDLYDAVQEIVTLYKSDLFPALNVQDADGANDGD